MNHRHFLIRLFADSNTVEEVESRDQQIAAVQEETGRGMLLALGGFSTDGTAFGKRFPNHRPGAPMAGIMVVVATLVAAAEEGTELPAPEVTFAPDSNGLLDQLNALDLGDGIAVVLLGNGSTFVRQFAPKQLPGQIASLEQGSGIGSDDLGDQTDLEQGDLLAGQPDVPPAAPGIATETTEGTCKEIEFSPSPVVDSNAPTTAGRKARASKES